MRRAGLVFLSLAAVALGTGTSSAKPSPNSAVTIRVTPRTAVYGSRITVTGQATGKNSGGATVTLYAKPAPAYSAAKAVASTTTSATGQYKFTTAPTENAIYFVKVHTAPQATSPQVKTNVKVSISLSLTGGAGHMFFIGFVLPSYTGKSVQIQRRTAHGWKKIASATLVPASSVPTAIGATTRSKYRKRLRLKAGTYRAFFDPMDGLRIANHSPKRKI
jgi:hypothetical protein